MNYWHIKAATLERELQHRELLKADAALAKVMADNGLDPKKLYRLNDADESVTEEAPNASP